MIRSFKRGVICSLWLPQSRVLACGNLECMPSSDDYRGGGGGPVSQEKRKKLPRVSWTVVFFQNVTKNHWTKSSSDDFHCSALLIHTINVLTRHVDTLTSCPLMVYCLCIRIVTETSNHFTNDYSWPLVVVPSDSSIDHVLVIQVLGKVRVACCAAVD
jgi:hypothetical protein